MTNEQMELGVQNLIWLQIVNINTDSVQNGCSCTSSPTNMVMVSRS